jgi:chaperonin cofactor prefoldin
VADPALLTAIGAVVTSATTGIAQLLSAGKRSDLEKRVDALEKSGKDLRADLDTTAGHVKVLREARLNGTGSFPAIREPLASQSEVADVKWRTKVEAALEEIEKWREGMEKRIASAEVASRKMRERWIAFSTEVRTVLRGGRMSNGRSPDLEDDRGSAG